MSSLIDKDAGFCSGSSSHEDDHHPHEDLHSPTDTSEDSVEVKFTPISKNKRKSENPSRVVPDPELGPLKKRFRYDYEKNTEIHDDASSVKSNPFRPWALSSTNFDVKPNPADILIRHPGVTTLHRAIDLSDKEQSEPLALVTKKPSSEIIERNQMSVKSTKFNSKSPSFQNSIENLIKQTEICRLPRKQESEPTCQIPSSSTSSSSSSQKQSKASTQRNYKNMTRERRIEANARERTRVHTISAAYDTLRKSIPSYSNSQKLSKLSVLRVACSYILYLSRMNGEDFSADQSEPPMQDCIDSVTRTIQTEGKLRRKKDE
jgi:atonal protein 8